MEDLVAEVERLKRDALRSREEVARLKSEVARLQEGQTGMAAARGVCDDAVP